MIFRRVFIRLVERRFLSSIFPRQMPRPLLFIVRRLDIWASFVIVRLISSRYGIDEDKVLFTNFSGNYDCNPKYISEEMLRSMAPVRIVWVTSERRSECESRAVGGFPASVEICKRYTWAYYKHLFSAHIIVDNGTSFASSGCKKKKGQILINTWHGSLGIKRRPKVNSVHNFAYNISARRTAAMTDMMISNSLFEESYYKECWFANVPVKRFGHPRNDPLFNCSAKVLEQIKSTICKVYGIDKKFSFCLYAPTFRDSGECFWAGIDYDALVKTLSRRFGGEWVVLVRLHNQTAGLNNIKDAFQQDYVINVTDYPDIVELMVVSDIGITDYSSWICEYIHTGRPGFLYVPDMDTYRANERDFYDPLETLPFPMAASFDELCHRIYDFNPDKYQYDCKRFLSMKGCIDDGCASRRTVNLIMEFLTSRRK